MCDLDSGVEGVGGQFEADLVVAFAGGAVGDEGGALGPRRPHQTGGDARPGDGRAQQVAVLVDEAAAHRRPDEVLDELTAQVVDDDLGGAQRQRFAPRRFKVLVLADVGLSRTTPHTIVQSETT